MGRAWFNLQAKGIRLWQDQDILTAYGTFVRVRSIRIAAEERQDDVFFSLLRKRAR